ncbi:hypothetical protein ATER59S_03809 [Aquamicrobium terrae]
MVFRSFDGRVAASLMVTGFVLSLAGCQSAGKAMDNGALQPDPPKVKASDLRAYCPKVTLREGTAYFNSYAKGGQDDPSKLAYQAAISDVTRDCSRSDGTLTMNVAAAGKVVPGPMGSAGTVTMPIRVVVAQGSQVLYSQLHQYKLPITDTSAATQFAFSDPNVSVPVPAADTYQVFVGFDEGPPKAAKPAAARPAPKVARKKKPVTPAAAPAQPPTQTSISDIPR